MKARVLAALRDRAAWLFPAIVAAIALVPALHALRAQTFAIMESIASEAVSPRFTDYEGSVQAVMAVDTLLSGLVTQGPVSAGAATSLRAQINQAYAAVAEPNSYKPLEFRRALGGAVRTIRSLQ